MDEIESKFAAYFEHWGIHLPKEDIEQRNGGRLQQSGWFVNYVWGKENGAEYLEFYAGHRMTNDRHVRLWATGQVDELDAPWDFMIVGREEEYRDHNERVSAELREKGLYL
jgi:hypothetical protein